MKQGNTVPDALFPTDNGYDIPTLNQALQGDFVDAPVRGWGSVPRTTKMRGTWHFYLDDYKFSAVWKSPDRVLKTAAVSVIEPNFTTDDQMPLAVCLYRIYQKRWLARYWQEHGLRVFVDLNVAEKCDGLNLLGVPAGWRAYATSAADYCLPALERQADLAYRHAGRDILLLVYGGGPKIRELCKDRLWVNIPDARNASRKESADA